MYLLNMEIFKSNKWKIYIFNISTIRHQGCETPVENHCFIRKYGQKQ